MMDHVLESQTFKIGETFNSVLTDVGFSEGELTFWVQSGGTETEEVLNDITFKLDSESPNAHPLIDIRIGTLCACKFVEDDQWYRACIIRKAADKKWVARFIDYGNCQVFDESDFFELPLKIDQIPPLATALSLDGSLQPLESANLWTSAAAKTLLDLLLYSEIEATVSRVNDKRIEIFCPMINDVLVTKGLAIFEKREYPYSDFLVAHKFEAYVSSATHRGTLFIQDVGSSVLLDQMMDLMADYYKDAPNRIALDSKDLAPGCLVAAVYSCDQNFYRAQVMNVYNEKCVVYFLDYGNKEQQDVTALFQLAPRFRQLPFQAIECKLHDIVVSDEKFSKDLQDFLIQNTTGKVLACEIIEHVRYGNIKFSITAKCDDEKLGTSLIAKGYAKRRRESEPLTYGYVELDIGSQHEVCIAHVESDGKFYVSLLKDAAKLDKLMDELSDYGDSALSLPQVSVDLPCCCLYDQDHNWYRAMIKSVSHDSCEVMYVDYGNCSSCPMTSIRKISKEFMSLHCQAIECFVPRQLSDEEIELLKNLYGKMVEVKFLRKTDSENSYYVKVLQEGNVLFPPLLKKDSAPVDFEPQKIKLDLVDKIKILRIESPENVWGRLISSEATLQRLCADLNQIYNKDKSESLNAASIGTLCVVYDADFTQWCRGKVVSSLSNQTIAVLLVDVGIVKSYPQNKLRQIISSQVYKLPCQAFNFKLTGAKLLDIYKTYPTVFTSFFLDNIFKAKFVNHDKLNNLYVVELYDKKDVLVELSLSNALQKPTDHLAHGDGADNGHEHIAKIHASLMVPLNESFVDVAVCFVEDPDCIWLQLQSNSTVLFRLIDEMQKFYNELPSTVLTFHQPQYDSLCAVKVKNQKAETWYRGRILCLYADIVEVQLIDFGNEVKVKQKNIKMLSKRFSQPDPQAIKCKLFNILPCGKQWTNQAARELDHCFKDALSVLAKFVDRHRSSYVVDINLIKDGNSTNISAYMVKHDYATWLDPAHAMEGANLTLKGHKPNGIGQGIQGTAKIPKPKLFYQSPGVALVGAELEVAASEVTSPDDFFLKISDVSHRQKYAALAKEVNAIFANEARDRICEDDFYVGQPCAIFSERVMQWCRGAVLDYSDLENMRICLVDYGWMVNCPMDEVKSLDMQFVVKAPPEAMRCTLQGIVSPQNGSWTAEAVNFCIDFFESDSRNLTCTIHACAGSDFSSYFICSVRTPLRNLADELVSTGFGDKAAIMGKVALPLKLKSFIYSNLGEVKGKEDIFYVTHVEAPNLFYCQLARQFPELDDLMDELQLHCDNNSISVTLDELILDCMCFAKYLDKWYRAHIVAPAIDDRVKVLFVDYGNSDLVQLSDVQKFTNEKFYRLPIQALPCSFKDVDIASMSSQEQQTTLALMNTELLEKEFDGVVIGSTNGKLHLDLFLNGNRINDVVTQKPVKTPSPPASQTNQEIYESTQHEKVTNLSDSFFLRKGAVLGVAFANCINPHNFYLWLDKLNEERLNCISTVDGIYTAMRNSDYKLEEVFPGDVICARRSKDMKWCRAKVLSAKEKDVEVFYVDTGETDTVLKAYDVKQLTITMGKWPKMAVSCTLSNIRSSSGKDWSSQAVQEFQFLVENDQLTAEFLHKDANVWSVKLTKGEMDLSKQLVDMGLALNSQAPCTNNADMDKNLRIDVPVPWKDEKQVFISSVASENEVYLQTMEAFDEMDDLKQVISQDKTLQLLEGKPKVHSFCLARFDVDEQIYRAEIVDTQANHDPSDSHQYEVRFVDFGNTAIVKVNDLYKLNSDYAKNPQSAIKCKLATIPDALSPLKIIGKLETLSESEDVTIFASFVTKEFGNENVVELRVLQGEKASMTLDSYLTGCEPQNPTNLTSSHVAENPPLQYTILKDILNQASRSIYVSHVENPGHVYCQLSEFCDDLDTLMDSIESYYNEDRSEDHVTSSDSQPVGSPCVAKYADDDAWYRAVVEEIVDADHLKVQFVDYGNSETLALSDIRKSKIGFCTLPIQAIHCYVAMVDHDSSAWTKIEIDDFDSRVATLQLKATFSRLISEKDSIFEVMLRLPDETLLNKEYMKSKSFSEPQEKDEFAADSFDDEKEALQTNLIPEPVIETLESVDLNTLTITEGEKKNCYISFAESFDNFYVQIVGTEDDLNALYGHCGNDAQNNQAFNSGPEAFSVGTYCVAKSPDDSEWYRGQITKLDDKPTVFFIDYGNFSTVDWNFIKPMSQTSSKLSIQAVCCCLIGLGTLSPEIYDEAIEFFFDLVEGAVVSVQFLQKVEQSWEVSLKVNGVHVAEKMIYEIEKKFPNFVPPSPAILASQQPMSTTTKSVQSSAEQDAIPSSEMVPPNTILLGKILYITDLESFYVKLDSAIGSISSNVNMTPTLVRQTVDGTWENAVSIKMSKSDDDLIIMTNECACLAKDLAEIQKIESGCESQLNIFHCQLFNSAELSNLENVNEKFAKEVLSKNVFITFKRLDQSSSKWEVSVSLSDGDVSMHLQTSSDSSLDQTHLEKSDDILRYNMAVFKQLKEMLSENQSPDTTLLLVETAIQNLESYNSKSASATTDDKKRHFSSFLPTPSPCKKPRLDKSTVPYNGTPVIFESIPEQDEKIVELFPDDMYKSSLLCVESPDCFYVKPDSFSDHILPKTCIDQLSVLENIKPNTLCAFINEEGETRNVKRGVVMSRNDDEVVLLDIDVGYKYALTMDKVFAYSQEWDSYSPLIVCCQLYGVSPLEDEWSTEADIFFSELIQSKNAVLVEFVEKCEYAGPIQKWNVNIVIDEKSVSSLLIEKNFAETQLENFTELNEKLIAKACLSAQIPQAYTLPHETTPSRTESDEDREEVTRDEDSALDTSDQNVEEDDGADIDEQEEKDIELLNSQKPVSYDKDQTPLEKEVPGFPHITWKKGIGFRLKLVESSSLSQMSDSVFASDDTRDLLQEAESAGDGVFPTFASGGGAAERMPGFMSLDPKMSGPEVCAETEENNLSSSEMKLSQPESNFEVEDENVLEPEKSASTESSKVKPALPEKDTARNELQESADKFSGSVYTSALQEDVDIKDVSEHQLSGEMRTQRMPGFVMFGAPPATEQPTDTIPTSIETTLPSTETQDLEPQNPSPEEEKIVKDPSVPECDFALEDTKVHTADGNISVDDVAEPLSHFEDDRVRADASEEPDDVTSTPDQSLESEKISLNESGGVKVSDVAVTSSTEEQDMDDEAVSETVDTPPKYLTEEKQDVVSDAVAADNNFEPLVTEILTDLKVSREMSDVEDIESSGVEITYTTMEGSLKHVLKAVQDLENEPTSVVTKGGYQPGESLKTGQVETEEELSDGAVDSQTSVSYEEVPKLLKSAEGDKTPDLASDAEFVPDYASSLPTPVDSSQENIEDDQFLDPEDDQKSLPEDQKEQAEVVADLDTLDRDVHSCLPVASAEFRTESAGDEMEFREAEASQKQSELCLDVDQSCLETSPESDVFNTDVKQDRNSNTDEESDTESNQDVTTRKIDFTEQEPSYDEADSFHDAFYNAQDIENVKFSTEDSKELSKELKDVRVGFEEIQSKEEETDEERSVEKDSFYDALEKNLD